MGPAVKDAARAGPVEGTLSGIEAIAGGMMARVGEPPTAVSPYPNIKVTPPDKKTPVLEEKRGTRSGEKQVLKPRFKTHLLLNLERLKLREIKRRIKKKATPGLNRARMLREELQVGRKAEERQGAYSVG